ncbi:hypothetical protein ACFQWF_07685 [Methylorubrum suomiense]|uniref:Uncharacterized protein n=1 Tax=Methylorubrum suomiense TaxID=144191 RepID=A0ABQ4UX16_9HYPH|nr:MULTISPECIES: hypothetical protein [Methylobacteriaceae]GJE76856.1 hypothetical protein BGCPKDLD_3455 [Methylorubrum suomiense]
MPRFLALAALSLAFVSATALPSDARQTAGQDRHSKSTTVKTNKVTKSTSNWSSIAPDIDRVGSLPAPGRIVTAPAVGGMPTMPFPGWGSGGGQRCDIVVKRPGGNPTQDMTGSIGHAKSHQSNGGAGRMRVCGAMR